MLGDATTCYDMLPLQLLSLSYHNRVTPLTSPTGKAPYYAGVDGHDPLECRDSGEVRRTLRSCEWIGASVDPHCHTVDNAVHDAA
jgi:hypothetical protein